ncbi:MAG: hypothetical protein IRZ08_14130 [Frankia sp.]|nr:hypothetical protein [Frankia sp.]
MRLDEHGRWVSDDGAYMWDENTQTWQPTGKGAGAGAGAAGSGATARAGSATAGGATSYGPGARTASAGAGGDQLGSRSAAPYGARPGGQDGYRDGVDRGISGMEARTGSWPVFAADERPGRDSSWRPDPAGGATGARSAGWQPGSAAGGARPGGPARADTPTGGTPSAGAAATGTPRAAATPTSTGTNRAWPAKDPVGTGPLRRPFDRSDPLGTGPVRRPIDRSDPLGTGPLPYGRSGATSAGPAAPGGTTGSWARDTGGRPNAGAGGGSASEPVATRGGSSTDTGPLAPVDSPGTEAMVRPSGSAAGRTDGDGGAATEALDRPTPGRFGGAGYSPAGGRGGRGGDERTDVDPDTLDDDQDEAGFDARGRRGGPGGPARGLSRDGDDRFGGSRPGDDLIDDEDEDDEDDGRFAGPGRAPGQARGIAGLLSGKPRVLVIAAAAAVVVLLVGGAFLLRSLGGGDGGERGGNAAGGGAATANRYDDNIRKSYLDVCLRDSNGKEAYCNCTLEKLEAGYSQDEFLRMNADVQSDAAQRVIQEIRAACKDLE